MNIIVLYGGKSCEHDISIITAKQAVKHISKDKKVTEVYVTRSGAWTIADSLKEPKDFLDEKKVSKLPKVAVLPGQKKLFLIKKNKLKPLFDIDAALMCFHGVNGEDGSVQGLLQLCSVPYSSSGVTASAVAMDKIVCKEFFKGLGVSAVKGINFSSSEFNSDPEKVISAAEKAIKFPMIVKPANLGSSIGISVCGTREQLFDALTTAFHFDTRVLVEKALKDFTEVNCSALCIDGEIELSELERPVSWKEFLTFEEKYVNNSKDSMSPSREFPFETEHKQKIWQICSKVCRALNCRGVVRLDFLIDNQTDKVYINEINSIPGSLSFYLWKGTHCFTGLIDKLIDGAVKEAEKANSLNYLFGSRVLTAAGKTAKKEGK